MAEQRTDAAPVIGRDGQRSGAARRRLRRGGALVVLLALVGMFGSAVPAHADVVGNSDAPRLPGRSATARPGVSELTPDAGMRPSGRRPTASVAAGTGITLGRPKTGPAPRMVDGAQEEPAICTPYISRLVTPNGTALTRVDYLAEVVCNFYLAGFGQAYLIERTSGARYNGAVLAAATPFSFASDYYGYSIGAVLIDGRLYDGGRQLEIGFDLALQTLNGAPWGGCFELPVGQRYLSPCYGLGTPTLSVSIGSGVFSTGLPAYNPAAWIRDIPAIDLLTVHVSGHPDPASTARQNIVDTASGLPAKTSDNSHVGRTNVTLDGDMLRGMLSLHLLDGFNFRVTTIAGGVHGENSRHYVGKAFDVDTINGAGVPGNPFNEAFKNACRAYGATEVLGPGDAGHDRHIHCAWPR
ncbi:hypothetical protein [Plantactinospora sp. KLBMP9567]|uniref:hypothetical protein n=1 Tax=Plantactinospora sp. KLBMP9567 TaxID=3085900 RepID=UPI002980D72C|nr:hypothetical protein [Plantactinospora sp. KLBMP9567]MDW5327992.1 hypothetical protein [Plantactinospora sp. KLBMP9567]